MNRDNHDGITKLTHLAALYRGIYSRVADKLGVDPSYVSRVARGERESEKVTAALDSELAHIEKRSAKLNHNSNKLNHNHNGKKR